MEAYELTMKERLLILDILPRESNVLTMRIKQNLVSKIGPVDEEFKEYGLKQNGPTITWDPKKSKITKKFDLKEKELDMIKESLTRCDATGKIHDDLLPLYDRFVVGKEVEGDKNADHKGV